jgi:hypothetical protein
MQELKAMLQSRLASAELDEAAPLSATDIADEALREPGAA